MGLICRGLPPRSARRCVGEPFIRFGFVHSGRLGAHALLVDSEGSIFRGLTISLRSRAALFAIVLQRLLFVIVFLGFFGEALVVECRSHFRIGGIVAHKNVIRSCALTVLGLVNDLESLVLDCLRSVPRLPSSVPAARCWSGVAVNVVGLVASLLIGWRIDKKLGAVISAYLVAMLLGFATNGVSLVRSLITKSFRSTQTRFAAGIFPVWLPSLALLSSRMFCASVRVVANWNPVTTSLVRPLGECFGNAIPVDVDLPEQLLGSSRHSELTLVVWLHRIRGGS